MKKLLILLLVLSQQVWAQDKITVSGTITDAGDGTPIVGASIVNSADFSGTISDYNGAFSFETTTDATLDISFIGYVKQTIAVNGQSTINVQMEMDVTGLDEVVVVGYGTMKKSDLTGAVASVKGEDLQRTPAAGIDQALQGRVAGVTVNANSGQPGEAAVVRIRGIGTVNGAEPVYVVDGMIVSDISFLSPNDIASTEILKDASATAIYGSRGANGVILISTKKGKSGDAHITYNGYYGVQNRWNKLDLMQSKEFAETLMKINPKASSIAKYQQQGFNAWMEDNIGTSPYYPLLKTESNPYGFDYSAVETDWQDEVFRRNAPIQNHYISMSGGKEDMSYVLSASYFNQDGTIIASDYERLTLRLNTSMQVKKWIKVGENLSFVTSTGRNAMNNNSSPGASILSAAIAMAPWDPTHYPDGSINNQGEDLSGQISAASNFKNVTNPFSMVAYNHPENKVERWVGNLFVELTPIKNFKFRSAVNLDLSNNRDKVFYEAYEHSSFDKRDQNSISSSMSRYSTLIFENIADYSLDLGKHSFSFMVGNTVEEYNYYTIGGSGASILNDTESNWYLSNTTEDQTYASDGVDRSRMISYLGRLHYNFNDRYLATANFRCDATSKFPENPYGYFPSVALAWRVSEEAFMDNISALDNLKVRFGWGRIGNESVGSSSFLLNVTESSNVFVGYPFGSSQELATGAAVLTQANTDGKWETTEQLNAGIDFSFLNGFISGSFDGFIRDTKDMILSVKAPAQVGNRFDPQSNIGTVRNQGIEIQLSHHKTIGDFDYTLGGNVSFIKNELTAVNGGSPIYSDVTLTDEGLALYTLWGYQYEGVYQSDEEAAQHLYGYSADELGVGAGDARFTDISGEDGKPDGVIDDYDKTDIGNPFPWLTYGFNVNAEYKNFDLQLFFQGVYGNEIYNAVRLRTEGNGNEATLSTSMRDVYVDYTDVMKQSMEDNGVDWTELINTEGSIPNPNGSSMNDATSSRFVESGAYLRLKNAQLGYTLPRSLTQKVNIDRCRLYVSASNLFTLTKYTGYDPEVGSGIDYGNYPQARSVMFGVNLDF